MCHHCGPLSDDPAASGFPSTAFLSQDRPSPFPVQNGSDLPAPTASASCASSNPSRLSAGQSTPNLTGPPFLDDYVVTSLSGGERGKKSNFITIIFLMILNSVLLKALGKDELAGTIY